MKTVTEVTERIEEVRPRRFRRYPEYKDSGVEWLGEIPMHWGVKRLKFVTHVIAGQSPPSVAVTDGIEGLPFLQGNAEFGPLNPTPHQVCDSAPKRAELGDILLSVRAPVGSMNIADQPYGIGRGLCAIRPPLGIDPSFCFYGVMAVRPLLHAVATGSTYEAVTASNVSSIPMLLPRQGEQRAIAAFLDRETSKIERLVARKEKLIELLQEKRTALITRAVTRGLDPNVPMKESGVEWLGEIPGHWHLRPLKRVSPEITVGVVVNPSTYVRTEGVPFLYGSDIHEGHIVVDAARRMSKKDSEALSKSCLRAGDLVCVRVGAPGVTAVVPPQLAGANCASVLIVRCGDFFDSQWLCYAMNSRLVRYQVELVQYGAAQEQFNVAHAVVFFVPLPPQAEQRAIAAFLDRETAKIDALIAKVRQAIDHLKEFRTALISAAVTGKIDVREEVA